MTRAHTAHARERGLGFVQFFILSTLVSHGINVGIQYFQNTSGSANAPAATSTSSTSSGAPLGNGVGSAPASSGSSNPQGGEGIEALKAFKRLALQEEQMPLVLTPEEMKELVTTVQILQHDGKYACPANFQELAQDPLFPKAFGIRVKNDGGVEPLAR